MPLNLICFAQHTHSTALCVTMNLQPRTSNPHHPQSDDRWPMTRGRLLLVAVLLEDDIGVARKNC